jgi:hypothetical protein
MMTRTFKASVWCASIVAVAMVCRPTAQEKEDRTLLSTAQMMAIINEASGERAMHHVEELVPYQRVRPASEYQGHFRESDVMAGFAKDYGFSNVAIETFPSGQSWQPSAGELWMTTPVSRKLYDIHDVALALGEGTPTGDVTGELVDIGAGRAQDLEGRDLAGKVLLSSSGGGAFTAAATRGAIGIISYSSLRVNDYPDEIPETRFQAPAGAASPTFGWAVSPKVGRGLALMLSRGQKITIRSIVKSEMLPGKLEVVHAEIPGDGSTTQEVAIGGHLYEAYIKQGANDDNSGCALTLEIGRAYLKLVKEGKLPKPRRTINFQWVPEISGTNAWLAAHPDKQKNIIGDLNFDMEGIRLTASRSYWIMQRTPDTVLHQRHRPEHDGVRVGARARARPLPRERLRAQRRHHVAQRQQRRLLHQDRQALRRQRSRDVHAARHPGRDVHHLARHVVPLVGRHARQGRRHAVQARGGCRRRLADGHSHRRGRRRRAGGGGEPRPRH